MCCTSTQDWPTQKVSQQCAGLSVRSERAAVGAKELSKSRRRREQTVCDQSFSFLASESNAVCRKCHHRKRKLFTFFKPSCVALALNCDSHFLILTPWSVLVPCCLGMCLCLSCYSCFARTPDPAVASPCCSRRERFKRHIGRLIPLVEGGSQHETTMFVV